MCNRVGKREGRVEICVEGEMERERGRRIEREADEEKTRERAG